MFKHRVHIAYLAMTVLFLALASTFVVGRMVESGEQYKNDYRAVTECVQKRVGTEATCQQFQQALGSAGFKRMIQRESAR